MNRGKKKNNSSIKVCMYGYKDLGSLKAADEFFQILLSTDPIFVPHKINICEPINTPFSLDTAKDKWVNSIDPCIGGGGVIFQGRDINKYYGYVDWEKDNWNLFSIRFSTTVMSEDKIVTLIQLVKRLFKWANAFYGYGAHSSQMNVHYMPGLTYKVCIGGITWMSLLGPPYVTMFGKDTIKSTPCYVEEFSDNNFMLLTSLEPQEPTAEILEIQKKVKAHLGEDAFFRGITQWSFTPEEVAAGKHITNSEGYCSPDFSAYIKDKKPQKDERMIVEVEDDGTYKVKIESI